MITIKLLANGQLPDSKGDLYEVPEGKSTVIKSIIIVNTNTVAEAVNLYVLTLGGTARRIIPMDMSLGSKYSLIFDDGLTLGEEDTIQGETSTASKVDFTISGVEK